MKKVILLFALYACNATAPVAEQKTVLLPAIAPIPLGCYMDSMAVRHNIPIQVIEGISLNLQNELTTFTVSNAVTVGRGSGRERGASMVAVTNRWRIFAST